MKTMEKHIYFVRHGESESNADRILCGHGSPLTEKGHTQAVAVGERIERIGVDALISSTYPRAVDTAEIIGKKINLVPEQHELLGEWTLPSLVIGQHLDHPDVKSIFESLHRSVDPNHRHSDEESFAELLVRAEAAIQIFEKHPAERICVVTHGGFLKVLIGTMIFREEFSRALFNHMVLYMPTINTGVTYVKNVKANRGWQLVTWNDQSHLG